MPSLTDTPAATPSPTEAPQQVVEVQAAHPNQAAGATGSAQSVDLSDYVAREARTADVLDRVPGVEVENYGPGLGSYLRIWGSSPDEVLVLVDGIRVNPGAGGGADLETLPLELFDRVDVARGTGAARYGADALGGVVDFRSDPATRLAGAGITVGSFGTVRVSASSTLQDEGWNFDVAAREEHIADTFRYYDELRHQELTRSNAGSQSLGGTGGASGEAFGGTLSLRLFGTDLYGGAPGLSQFPTPNARHGESLGLGLLHWTNEASPTQGIAWDVDGGERLFQTSFNDPTPSLGAPIDTVSHEEASTLEVNGRRALGDWLIAAGADGRDERIGDGQTGAHEREVGGIHADVLATWGGLEVEGAARGEADDEQRAVDLKRVVSTVFLPSAGAAYHAGPHLTFRIHGGRAYRLPTFSDRWLANQETVSGNPDLRPEDAWTGDAGVALVEGNAGTGWGRWSATVELTGFYTRLYQSILFAPVSSYRWEAVNAGSGYLRGGQVSGAFTVGYASLSGNWTHAESELDATGEPFPDRPTDKVVGRLAGKLLGGAVEPFVEATWQTAAYADFFGNLEDPGGTMLGAGITATVRCGRAGAFFLTAEGTNLLNADILDARYFPPPGRAFWLSLAWRLPRHTPTSVPTEPTKGDS